MTRRSLTKAQRVRVFDAGNGICHLCGTKIQIGEEWDVSHDIPLEAGGADEPENMKPAHRTCHRAHTAEVDAPLIAKVKRQRQKHIGIRKPSRFATARDGKFKAKVGGGIVLRATGEEI